ncbi:hypothetical protein EDB89DRAFT_2003954 [Lactarius sanguifluus]|nr:hypothetical protein EDB89DRAFT_2003954 [Lactarius sanguifluus]
MCVCPSFSSLLSRAMLTPTLGLQCLSRTPRWELFFGVIFYLVFANLNHQPPLPIIFDFGLSHTFFSSLLSLTILCQLICFYTPLVHFLDYCLSYHSERGVQ